jgi:hypothetical protein
MILMCFFGKAVVMSMHDQQTADKLSRVSALQRTCARLLCRLRAVSWIAVSDIVRQQLVCLGVPGDRIRVVAAHLEPVSAAPFSELPDSLQSFIRAHSPVMSVYGWRLVADGEGRDLYGFTEAVDATAVLARETPDLGLVICIPQPDNEERLQALRQLVASRGLTSRVYLQLVPLPDATALWAASDIFLRPTTTDGDSVAVREALSAGTVVVASDYAPRPSGVAVYSGADRGTLTNTIREVLREGALWNAGKGARQEDGQTRFAQIEETYLEAIARPRRWW